MVRAVARLDEFLEDVVEALILEISLLFRDPFLQPEVRFDDEFLLDHVCLLDLLVAFSTWIQQQARLALSRCSATRRAAIIFTCSSINCRAPAASRASMSDANSLCVVSTCCATVGVSVGLCAGQETCCSEMSCTTSTRLCDASATARWNSRPSRVNAIGSSIRRSVSALSA